MKLREEHVSEYFRILDKVVNKGIEAGLRDYKTNWRLAGGIAGFESCKGKNPDELKSLLKKTREEWSLALLMQYEYEEYWCVRTFYAEVEWTCESVSVWLHEKGYPVIVGPPNANPFVL